MRFLFLLLVSLGALCAQDIAGSWQGAATANGEERRVVIKLDRDASNRLTAVLYFIDANPRPVPAESAALQGSTLQITFIPGRLSYEGKLGSDGNSIAGTISQGPGGLALNLTRATPATAWAIPSPPKPPVDNAPPVFEVATVKPAPPDAQNAPFTVNAGVADIKNRSLTELMIEAYGVHTAQIIGAADWMKTVRWDISAKPAVAGDPERLRVRLRNLLADRFGLRFHNEQRELAVYTISMGRDGQHKMRPTVIQGDFPLGDYRGAGTIAARNTSVASLAELLQSVALDRPVVDRSGITGRFDFTLEWRPDEFQFTGRAANMRRAPNVDSFPDLFTAFQEQLGLRLEAVRAATNVLVIDSAQRPSEN